MNFKTSFSVSSLLAFFLAVVPLISSSLVGNFILQNESTIQHFKTTDWLLLTFVCTITSAFALTPPTLLALCFGYFLGWMALSPLIFLNMSAIFLIYGLFGQTKSQQLVQYFKANPRTKTFFERIQENEFNFVFFAKLSPILPFALTNLLFALSGIKFKNMLLGGFLGMIPRTVLAIWIGKEAREIQQLINTPNENWWSRAIIATLVALSFWGIVRVLTKRRS